MKLVCLVLVELVLIVCLMVSTAPVWAQPATPGPTKVLKVQGWSTASQPNEYLFAGTEGMRLVSVTVGDDGQVSGWFVGK